jgi:hypothetical protein
MKIMGLNSTVNFITWLISSFIPMVFVSIIVAGIGRRVFEFFKWNFFVF